MAFQIYHGCAPDPDETSDEARQEATESHVDNLAKYLKDFVAPDITVTCGQKSWKVHKIVACSHSKWFRKALEGGFKEAKSGLIELQEDDCCAESIGHMINYFYEASVSLLGEWDLGEWNELEWAKIALVADKYCCPSLFEYAHRMLQAVMQHKDYYSSLSEYDWVEMSELIFEHTTSDFAAHVKLRQTALAPLTSRRLVYQQALKDERTMEFLDMYPEAMKHLLLHGPDGPKGTEIRESLFVCHNCNLTHTGNADCMVTRATVRGAEGAWQVVRKCFGCKAVVNPESKITKFAAERTLAYRCERCGGKHNQPPSKGK